MLKSPLAPKKATILKTSRSKVDITKYESTVKAVVNRLLLSRRISQFSLERDDLYQIGWMALMNCEKTYDESRGIQFDTYATKAIINAVNRELKRLSDRRAYTMTTDVEEAPREPSDKMMHRLIDVMEHSGKFTPAQRRVFWLKFTDNLSFTEIGNQVGASRETVRQGYNLSIERLKELMANEF